MKKIIAAVLFLVSFSIYGVADSFTDAIQDLAVVIACKGTYAGAEAGYDDDPDDFYTPNMMASRFASESGNKTMTATFYGVCFNYAQFAFTEIKNSKSWYNKQGMYESQFWLAGVHDNPNQIELMGIGTKNDYSRLQNGEYIKTYNTSLRSGKTHNGATNHAWLWIERADGVWFWVDPTWTDTGGYVVYGYVKNGQEIQCRPDEKYCVIYPNFLNNLPSPPPMGQRLAPSKTANSTNRQETIQDAATDWITSLGDKAYEKVEKFFFDVDYFGFREWASIIASTSVPFSAMFDGEKSLSLDKISFGLDLFALMDNGAVGSGLEYLRNYEDGNEINAGLINFYFLKRLLGWTAFYAGGGIGLRFDFSEDWALPKAGGSPWYSYLPNTAWFAFKLDAGFLINLSRIFMKVEVSYDNILGPSLGVGLGWGFDPD